ncbi:phosphodiester glycosidase family protein [Dermabacter hominis]|uniref:phosphodiester glycosidase family protein n=1 Tax=Dermabacter hominis TaxID=36740 RepID=UPI0021A725D5|nr:phosphodiester glycosidase family protein [Dermabacter hominis]MCT1955219.1 phosphodiester glycosidase family protein [Dermabacter hominis]MCT2055239.1 phosphodiester glycosidase family protein [Dermabacter hominis]MCT2083657.1 phosphodiester glycosidase family protein [Dermabacter hominis]MCT2090743.1 phosphodiester glycosidase family protein [Dermabacter hominis]MCT2189386.1 phosphodiester glycosidase family protein [Dermabacter hominis]
MPRIPASGEVAPAGASRPRRTRGGLRALAVAAALAIAVPGSFALPADSPSVLAPATAQAAPSEDDVAKGGVFADSQTRRVAPGLDLTTFSRLESAGWNEGSVLTADLTEQTLSMDIVNSGTVASRAPLGELMTSGDRGSQAVAAINSAFFDINFSDAPVYSSVSNGKPVVASDSKRPAFTIAGGRAVVQALTTSGKATLADGSSFELATLNDPSIPEGKIGVYNARWGSSTLDRPIGGPDKVSTHAAFALIQDGEVVKVSGSVEKGVGPQEIPEGAQLLLGREAGADKVAALKVGDKVDVAIGPDQKVDLGVQGSDQILKNGEVMAMNDDSLVKTAHPRTAIGVSKDGSKVFAVVLDGRSADSRGMTLPELGQLFKDLGAYNAVNLDGGGSSAMIAREAGSDGPTVWNTPSDGEVRSVADALVFYSSAPKDVISDAKLSTSLENEKSVFPGLHRTLNGTALGKNLAPLAADGTYAAEGNATVDTVDSTTAVVEGVKPGAATVTYTTGAHQDSLNVRVLGDMLSIRPSARTLSLPDPESVRSVTLTGVDSDGRRARIETQDVKVEASKGFTVTDDGLGTWTVAGTGDAEAGTVTFSVGDVETTIPVSYGTKEEQVFDFSDLGAFKDGNARATGSLEPAKGEDGKSPAVRLQYDFTQSTATRGYYLIANEPVKVEGNALAFTADMKGDATGVWPRLQVVDAKGTRTNINGENVTVNGWSQVVFKVPEGVAQPLTVEAIRLMETRSDAQYKGDVTISGLRALTTSPASTEANSEAAIHDPALLAMGTVNDRPQRIAVMSDAQFVARDPNSPLVQGARRTLREIKAEKPDLLVINGDFVDEASPEDFALAKTILDEEWGTEIPYLYVPGNHEVMGGKIENFEKAFGSVTNERTLGRTKILTLNTAGGSLRSGGIDQIAQLEKALDEVENSDALTGIVVFFHHPPSDPLPAKTSQLSDQREARELERVLGEFRERSGKSAAVVNGHVGVFNGSAVEGVTYLINGNSGKNPDGTPETGGFTGWTMLGINPGAGKVGRNPTTADRVAWLAAETKPWVDDLTLTLPKVLAEGESADFSAVFTQDGRTVPVAWPVTAQYSGRGVLVDDGSEAAEVADDSAVIRVNPLTGEVTAIRPGEAELVVTVNGRSHSQCITVEGASAPAKPAPEEEPSDSGVAPAEPAPSEADPAGGAEDSDEAAGTDEDPAAGAEGPDEVAGTDEDGAAEGPAGQAEPPAKEDPRMGSADSGTASRTARATAPAASGHAPLPRTGVELGGAIASLMFLGLGSVLLARSRKAGMK